MDPQAYQFLELNDNAFWPRRDDRQRLLLLAINVPGYYSLAIRILGLLVASSPDLTTKFDVRFVEWDNCASPEFLVARINNWEPDILALSVNIWNRTPILNLATEVKRVRPEVTIIAGGQEMTNSVVDYLKLYDALDYAIDGEGEIPFRQFLENWNPEARSPADANFVSGFLYRQEGLTVKTRPADCLTDLNQVPSVILAGLVPVREKNKLGVLVEGTRGCPFRCSYCFEGSRTNQVRMASLARIRQEILYMADRGATYFHMLDPILCNSKIERLSFIAETFREAKERHGDIAVSVEAYGEQISREVAAHLSFCSIVDIGLQSINPQTVKEIHRAYVPEKFCRGISYLRGIDTTFNIYLILGLPFETMVSFLKGVRFVIDRKPTRMFVNELCLLNGTELRRRAEEYDYVFSKSPPYKAISNRWLSSDQMAMLRQAAKTVENRYNLSLKAKFVNLPWLKQAGDDGAGGEIRLVIEQPCGLASRSDYIATETISCLSHLPQNLLKQLDKALGADIILLAGDDVPVDFICRLASQCQLAGAARLQLNVPPTFLSRDDVIEPLIQAGIWHYVSYIDDGVDLLTMERILRKLKRNFPLRGQSEICPFIELSLIVGDQSLASVRTKVGMLADLVDVIVLPNLTMEMASANDGWKRLFFETINHHCWIKVSEGTFKYLIEESTEGDELVDQLSYFKLIADSGNRLPCFAESDKIALFNH